MRLRHLIAILVLASLAVAMPAATSGKSVRLPKGKSVRVPKGFFGIAPQTPLTPEDARYMKAGGIESVRWPLVWAIIQPAADAPYNWSYMDEVVAVAAQAGLRVLPSVGSTPSWLAHKETTIPVNNGRQRAAWAAFLRAAVKRYGPGGEFWREHGPGGSNQVPLVRRPMPIREWQIWNEPNFFYFAYPVSPPKYAKLVKLSSRTIKGTKRSAKVILAGLFGKPTAKGKRGMPAATFLTRLYRAGVKGKFDGIALHPYAVDAAELKRLVEGLHDVTVKYRDRVGLYVTEMGWGSENNFNQVAFEQGIRGQVRQLKASYGYLIANRPRLNLKQVYWFSWKDIDGACNFCDSVGFFRAGSSFKPKPAWRAFVAITGGRPRP